MSQSAKSILSKPEGSGPAAAAEVLQRYQKAQQIASDALEKFDSLDFDYVSNQQWDKIKESHTDDIRVYWPDGHVTVGLERHIEDLKAMVMYMPDYEISDHPVRIVGADVRSSKRAEHPAHTRVELGKFEWTCVLGTMHGTFSRPMPVGDGEFIQPTHKTVHLRIVTVGHWLPEGKMDEEYLFWDNEAFKKQIGLS